MNHGWGCFAKQQSSGLAAICSYPPNTSRRLSRIISTTSPAKGGKQELPVMPYSEFKGDMATTSWLINAAYAKAWQELQR